MVILHGRISEAFMEGGEGVREGGNEGVREGRSEG
jgi:hypothetical protein